MSEKKGKGPMSEDMALAMPDWPCRTCAHREKMEYKGQVFEQWNSGSCSEYDEKPFDELDNGGCQSYLRG